MKQTKFISAALLLSISAFVHANDFPTADKVLYVMNCMQKLGNNSTHDLTTCSCRIDAIAEAMTFEDFNYAMTYDRNKRMTGEKGGLFRDNKSGKDYLKTLEAAEESAGGKCRQVVQIAAPTDLTKDKRFEDIKEIKDR